MSSCIRATASPPPPARTLGSSLRPTGVAELRGDDTTVIAGTDFGTGFDGIHSARQVVYAPRRLAGAGVRGRVRRHPRGQTPTEMHYFVDASSGRILDKWDAIHTAKPGGGRTT